MRRYGTKKTRCSPNLSGHSRCIFCHPPRKGAATAARREGLVEIGEQMMEEVLQQFPMIRYYLTRGEKVDDVDREFYLEGAGDA